MTSQKAKDFLIAYNIHEQLNCLGVTENAVSNKENCKPKTLIDQTLELIDPTPNIYTLFVQFNERFFWSILLPVEVKWSNKMTSCAGVCYFHRRNKQCVISLSAPLLKLRPRKDLVETLLHEMIHAFLFLTNNDRDRDGHGPNFCKHMHRINKEAGTNITIYHNFHDEVRLYQQHWWKCNGPCQHRPPFFGTVRRAMNRAPGPSDFWWHEHQQNCNGQFIKIREPENFKSKQKDKSKSVSNNMSNKNIVNWFTKNTSTITKSVPTHSKAFTHTNSKTLTQTVKTKTTTDKNEKINKNSLLGVKKLGNTSNNVHGWGTNGPNTKVEHDNTKNITSKSPKFACSGTLGGNNSGRSNLLTKFLHINDDKSKNKLTTKDSSLKLPSLDEKRPIDKPSLNLNQSKNDFAPCPICNALVSLENINEHIDLCLMSGNVKKEKIKTSNDSKPKAKSTLSIDEISKKSSDKLTTPIRTFFKPVIKTVDTNSNKRLKLDDSNDVKDVCCPVCNKMLPSTNINRHLDECLLESDTIHKTSVPSHSRVSNNESIIVISSSSNSDDSLILENTKELSCDDTSTGNIGKNDTLNCQRKCLVCNTQILPEVSLNDHLEECIGSVFNDDVLIVDDEIDDNTHVAENNTAEKKYPCPVCMQLVSDSLMNKHLDACLKNT